MADCLGAYWETKEWNGALNIDVVKEKINEQLEESSSKNAPLIGYTGNIALTLALGKSIVDCRKFDARHFAQE